MKKILTLIIGLSVGLMMIGCTNTKQVTETPPVDEPVAEEPTDEETPEEIVGENVSEAVVYSDFSYENGIITYTVLNQTDSALYYGMAFDIHKLNGKLQWEDTELTKDRAWIEIAMELIPGEKLEEAIDVSTFELSTGTYRIVRKYTQDNGAVFGAIEFSVNETEGFDYFKSVVEEITE